MIHTAEAMHVHMDVRGQCTRSAKTAEDVMRHGGRWIEYDDRDNELAGGTSRSHEDK